MERDWKKYKFEVLVTNVERKKTFPHSNLFNKNSNLTLSLPEVIKI